MTLGAGVFIQKAGANSSKVCMEAVVYRQVAVVYVQGAGVYRQNQKKGIAQVQGSDLPDLHLTLT